MKLLIISDMAHYFTGREFVGWGPTVQEINELASLFKEVRHVGCLYPGPPPETSLPYESKRITFVPVRPTGGETLLAKVNVLRMAPHYLRTIIQELRHADVVHVRCPANISLLALLVLALRRHPPVRWVKYAGNWSPEAGEPLTYAFQRWWLRKGYHRGVVTINGRWPGQPPHVHSFFNPCLTDDELACAKEAARGKSLETPIRLMYAGRLEKEKGVGRVLKVLALLNSQGYPAVLDLAGDGPERTEFENQASRDGIGSLTTFHGWLPRPKLNALYSRSHFFVMPSLTEGWPKVLSEAMAYGVVPLGSAMGSIPQLLEALGTGKAIPADDVEGYYEAILAYRSRPQVWKAESDRAVQGATQFTYSCYLSAVRELMGSVFGAKERPINGRAGRS